MYGRDLLYIHRTGRCPGEMRPWPQDVYLNYSQSKGIITYNECPVQSPVPRKLGKNGKIGDKPLTCWPLNQQRE